MGKRKKVSNQNIRIKVNPRKVADDIKEKFNSNIFYVDRYPRGYLYAYDKDWGFWQEVSGRVEQYIRKKLPASVLSAHLVREIMADLCQSLYRREMPKEPPWHLINFANGVWNLKTKKFVELNNDSKEPPFFLSRVPHIFSPESNKRPELINSLFSDWVSSEHVPVLYELLGYSLLRCQYAKKFFTLYGPGDNGKTTYAELLRMVVGRDNCSALSMDEIISDRFAVSSLMGKMANISGELVATIKRTDRLKLLTGGDQIFAQEKFQAGFFFTPYAKLLFMGNSIPSTPDPTRGFYERTLIIPFLNNFPPEKRNPRLLERLREEEMEGLLVKIVNDTLPVFIKGGFRFSKDSSHDELRRQWDSLSNPLDGFFRKYLVPNEGKYFAPNFVISKSYETYCQENNTTRIGYREIADYLKKEGYKRDTKRLSDEEMQHYKTRGFDPSTPCRGWWMYGSDWRYM